MKLIITAFLSISWLLFQPKNITNASGEEPNKIYNPTDTLKFDSETGLIIDENLYMIKAQCTSCHSSKLVTTNSFTRDGWKQKIRWMQTKHNLWELGDAEKIVLDYLEKNYGPKVSTARRAPLKNIQWYSLP